MDETVPSTIDVIRGVTLLLFDSCPIKYLINKYGAKPKKPRSVGRVPKAEEAAWRAEMEAYEASLNLLIGLVVITVAKSIMKSTISAP